MSQPDNSTTGRYVLRSGKPDSPSHPSSPTGHMSFVEDTVPRSPVIIFEPSPAARLDFTRSAASASSRYTPAAPSLTTTAFDFDSDAEMTTSSTLTPAAFAGRPSEYIQILLKTKEFSAEVSGETELIGQS